MLFTEQFPEATLYILAETRTGHRFICQDQTLPVGIREKHSISGATLTSRNNKATLTLYIEEELKSLLAILIQSLYMLQTLTLYSFI